jgi:hypothetical protein
VAVKTEIWVKAHLRRCFAEGLTGVVARRGAAEAGAVFVKISLPDGYAKLLGPAPGPAYDSHGRRTWSAPLGPDPVSSQEADRYLSRQAAIDPDIWVLDIDDATGTGLLEVETGWHGSDGNSGW